MKFNRGRAARGAANDVAKRLIEERGLCSFACVVLPPCSYFIKVLILSISEKYSKGFSTDSVLLYDTPHAPI